MSGAQAAVSEYTDGDTLVARLVGFIRFLREQGFGIGIQEQLDALQIAANGALLDARRLRWGLRALLCSDAAEWMRFEELFNAYWRSGSRREEQRSRWANQVDTGQGRAGLPGGVHPAAETDQAIAGDEAGAGAGGSKGGASAYESLANNDFRLLNDAAQMQAMERLVENLARRMRRYWTRRQHVERQGRRIELRRTIRRSLAYGGLPLDLVYRQRRRRLPRLIVLLDVSRSMSLYSYFFLRFARGLVSAFKDADAFVYHTRLVHVTEALLTDEPRQMREKLAVLSQGWAGGTRIGESLETFNRDYARRIVNSRSIVIIMSDGYDTGEPERLSAALSRIRQRARKIVWLNPLLGRDAYQPVAEGMRAALPYIDLFAPAHNLASLSALESQLLRL